MALYIPISYYSILYVSTVYSIEHTVSFHNFKSQDFKLSVSNPKQTCVAHVSVLSQISNCQGLGRKNTFDILKTDRSDSADSNSNRSSNYSKNNHSNNATSNSNN